MLVEDVRWEIRVWGRLNEKDTDLAGVSKNFRGGCRRQGKSEQEPLYDRMWRLIKIGDIVGRDRVLRRYYDFIDDMDSKPLVISGGLRQPNERSIEIILMPLCRCSTLHLLLWVLFSSTPGLGRDAVQIRSQYGVQALVECVRLL